MLFASSIKFPWIDVVDANAQGSDLGDRRGTQRRLKTIHAQRATRNVDASDDCSPPSSQGDNVDEAEKASPRGSPQFARCSRIDLGGEHATAIAAHPNSQMLVVGTLESAKLQIYGV